ncbi:MAG: NAD(P)H-binding protein [Thermoanaerobaculia bacterium]|jgi:NAD(P)H dehydrogenase (quinone)
MVLSTRLHFFPPFVTLGATGDSDTDSFPIGGFWLGSLIRLAAVRSMTPGALEARRGCAADNKETRMNVVTGASGKLGHHVVEALLDRVPASEIAVAVPPIAKEADSVARGLKLRQMDYDNTESVARALAGADRMLLISNSEVEGRAPRHGAAVGTTKKSGVKLLTYPSILNIDRAKMELGTEHRQTEEMIRASGAPFVFPRSGWYIENSGEKLALAWAHGALAGAAAAVVLTRTGHKTRAYEFAWDQAFTLAEMAAETSASAGKSVVYTISRSWSMRRSSSDPEILQA